MQVLRLRRDAEAGARLHATADELVADAVREHEATGFTEIHMVNGESPHVDFDFYVDTIAKLHEALPDVTSSATRRPRSTT